MYLMLQRVTTTLKFSPLLKYMCIAFNKLLSIYTREYSSGMRSHAVSCLMMSEWHLAECCLSALLSFPQNWLQSAEGHYFRADSLQWQDSANLQKHTMQALLLDTSVVHLFEVRVPRDQAERALSCCQSIMFNHREKSIVKKPVLLHRWAAAVSKRAEVW